MFRSDAEKKIVDGIELLDHYGNIDFAKANPNLTRERLDEIAKEYLGPIDETITSIGNPDGTTTITITDNIFGKTQTIIKPIEQSSLAPTDSKSHEIKMSLEEEQGSTANINLPEVEVSIQKLLNARVFKIDISGLDKAEIITALFENVYCKSKASKASYNNLAPKLITDSIGIYTLPDINKIRDAIRNKSYIDSIGCVQFNMDISSSTLNTEFYDIHHQTGVSGIESAVTIIDRFKKKKEKIDADFQEAKNKTRAINNSLEMKPELPYFYSSFSTAYSAPTFFQNDISSDRRFTKSQEPGILYIAKSMGYIDDETLKGYGLKEEQWERSKDHLDHIIIVKTLSNDMDKGRNQGLDASSSRKLN